MKVQVLSDLHIEFEEFDIEHNDSDVVILAGDIHVKEKGVLWALENIKDKPVLYILGNHEFYGKAYPKLVTSLKEIAEGTNVKVLEKDTVTLDGVNFMGCTLWTDFELFGDSRLSGYQCQQVMTDFKKIRVSPKYSKLRSIDVASIHRQSLDWLKEQLEAYRGMTNVVITHHGPSALSLPGGKEGGVASAAYVSNLESVISRYTPNVWVHGHLHNSSEYKIGNCQVICNPRGYPDEQNPDFKKEFIVEVNSV
jgi:Icc-related predicted phosphoesterase